MKSTKILLAAILLIFVSGCTLTIGPGKMPPPTLPAGSPQPAAPPAQPTKAPAPPTKTVASPSPSPLPAGTQTPIPPGAPLAPAPTKSCASGPPPASLSQFSRPASSITNGGQQYWLVGRTLTVDFQLADSEGTDVADLHRVQSESCTIHNELKYDWVYTAHYAKQCPGGLGSFPEPVSGDLGPYGEQTVVGRAFYMDGVLKELSGRTSGVPYEENGTCQGHSWRYIVYVEVGTPIVPEAGTLLLLGSGVAALAGWAALQIRSRKRQG